MAKNITGIKELHEKVAEVGRDLRAQGKMMPQNKIVLVDYAWDLSAGSMPVVEYLTDGCAKHVKHRSTSISDVGGMEKNIYQKCRPFAGVGGAGAKSNFTTRSLHGTACAAVLKLSRQTNELFDSALAECTEETKLQQIENERNLWDICPDTSVVLTPIRRIAEIPVDRFRSTLEGYISRSKSFLDQNKTYQRNPKYRESIEANIGLLELLDRVLKEAGDKGLAEIWCDIVIEVVSEQPLDEHTALASARKKMVSHIGELNPSLSDLVGSGATLLYKLSHHLFEEFGIAKTLDRIIRAAQATKETEGKSAKKRCPDQALSRGDVVVMPIQFQIDDDRVQDEMASERVDETEKWISTPMFFNDLPGRNPSKIVRGDGVMMPVIIYPEVEAKIRILTQEYKISVVIAAGNDRANLSTLDLNEIFNGAMCNAIHKDREKLFKNYGVGCGAVIVGATDLDKENWLSPIYRNAREQMPDEEFEEAKKKRKDLSEANHGICVDAFGRGSALSVTGAEYENDTVLPKKLYAHWAGASIAAVVTAACLATLQQYRMAVAVRRGEPKTPTLKPIEARSHLRVYRALECIDYPCHTELMGPPPNVMDMLKGLDWKC